MQIRLKICGVTNVNDAKMVVDEGADILGFNFFAKSLRYISPISAREIIRQLPFYIPSVGILVRPTLSEVQKTIDISEVKAIQIYEPLDFDIYDQIPIPVIIAYRLQAADNKFSVNINTADMILIDSYSKDAYGGTGKTFNWDIIPSSLPCQKLILAGGITTNNISEALERVGPAVIDVASGSESAPGKKDKKKVRELVAKIKGYK